MNARSNGIVPAPIAELPWKLMLLLFCLAGFGAVVLYSAAGGSLLPWAAPHLLRFTVALGLAIGVHSCKEKEHRLVDKVAVSIAELFIKYVFAHAIC